MSGGEKVTGLIGKKITALEFKEYANKHIKEIGQGIAISEELCDDPIIMKGISIEGRMPEFREERDKVFNKFQFPKHPKSTDMNAVINWYVELLENADGLC